MGVKDFVNDSTKALLIKRVTMGGGGDRGSKIVPKFVTSFMDNPKRKRETEREKECVPRTSTVNRKGK